MHKITISDLIVKKIEEWNVKFVPIFQGGAITQVLGSIGKSKKIRYYCPHHEQALAMSVDTYARINGFGVGLVTSGPGATNLITGIACSYYDSIPCIYFTGQVGQIHITGSKKVRQLGFQESDVVNLLKPITKFSYQLKNKNEVNKVLDKAFKIATEGRPGPVVIDVPFNIQKQEVYYKKNKNKKNSVKLWISKKNRKIIIRNIKLSKKPIILVGGGLRISNQINNFLKIINDKKIPFVTTWSSQDICESSHHLYFGSVGKHANMCANEVLKNSDYVFTLGVRFSPKIVGKILNDKIKKMVAVDIDKYELTQGNIKPEVKINADIAEFLKILESTNLEKNKTKDWLKECKNLKIKYFNNKLNLPKSSKNKYVNPYNFFRIFSILLPEKSFAITDAGANLTYCMQSFLTKKKQRLISAWGNSPMGYSIAAGIGAAISGKNKNVICFIGDGSFLINVQELNFIKNKNLNLKIVVINNKVYGNTNIGAKVYKVKNIGNNLTGGYFSPNIKKICKGFEIKYLELNSEKKMNLIIKNFLKQKGPIVLNVNISPNHPLLEYKI